MANRSRAPPIGGAAGGRFDRLVNPTRRLFRLHGRYEAVTPPWQGLDEARRLCRVPESASDLRHTEVEPALEVNEGPVSPDQLSEFVPGDNLARPGGQHREHTGRLGLQLDLHTIPPQLPGCRVEVEDAEPGSTAHTAHTIPWIEPQNHGPLVAIRPFPQHVRTSHVSHVARGTSAGSAPIRSAARLVEVMSHPHRAEIAARICG